MASEHEAQRMDEPTVVSLPIRIQGELEFLISLTIVSFENPSLDPYSETTRRPHLKSRSNRSCRPERAFDS